MGLGLTGSRSTGPESMGPGPAGAAHLAAHALARLRRRLDEGPLAPAYARDINAAAAELAEVAGWVLFDAECHDAANRANQWALRLARAAGDRSIELLTVQNIALWAGWLGRPHDELTIARSVLDGKRLTPRVEAVFRMREARGLAGTAGAARAACSFGQARSLLQDGERGDDPSWAWWMKADEIDGHHGWTLMRSGAWEEAIPLLRRAAAQEEAGAQVGYRGIFDAWLLTAYLGAGAWHDAVRTVEDLAPVVGRSGSGRAHAQLRRAARPGPGAPAWVRDALRWLDYALDASTAPCIRVEGRATRD
jgi:hypothetical protein